MPAPTTIRSRQREPDGRDPDAPGEEELVDREPPRGQRGRQCEHRRERAADGDDQQREAPDDRQVKMDRDQPLVRDPGPRPPLHRRRGRRRARPTRMPFSPAATTPKRVTTRRFPRGARATRRTSSRTGAHEARCEQRRTRATSAWADDVRCRRRAPGPARGRERDPSAKTGRGTARRKTGSTWSEAPATASRHEAEHQQVRRPEERPGRRRRRRRARRPRPGMRSRRAGSRRATRRGRRRRRERGPRHRRPGRGGVRSRPIRRRPGRASPRSLLVRLLGPEVLDVLRVVARVAVELPRGDHELDVLGALVPHRSPDLRRDADDGAGRDVDHLVAQLELQRARRRRGRSPPASCGGARTSPCRRSAAACGATSERPARRRSSRSRGASRRGSRPARRRSPPAA